MSWSRLPGQRSGWCPLRPQGESISQAQQSAPHPTLESQWLTVYSPRPLRSANVPLKSTSTVRHPAAQASPAAPVAMWFRGSTIPKSHTTKTHGCLMFPSLIFDHHSEMETTPAEGSGESGWNLQVCSRQSERTLGQQTPPPRHARKGEVVSQGSRCTEQNRRRRSGGTTEEPPGTPGEPK